MLGTWITHLFGGSAGREGVAVQIGATLSHEAGRRLHIRENKPVMLITGMAAGFGCRFWRSVPDATGRCIFCHGGDRCRIS